MKKNIFKIFAVIFVIAATMCIYFFKKSSTSSEIPEIDNQAQIENKLNNGLITMINFTSDSCPACIKMEPEFKSIQKKYDKKANILKVDVINSSDMADKYKIMYTPTQIFYDNDGKAKYRHEGYLSKADMAKKLDELGKI